MHMIQLTNREISAAIECGRLRREDSIAKGLVTGRGLRATPEEAMTASINHAACEIALAHVVDLKWQPTINTHKLYPDLMPHWDIRCHAKIRGNNLLIRSSDPDLVSAGSDEQRRFVYGAGPLGPWNYAILGWMYTADAKLEQWKENREYTQTIAYMAPIDHLTPFGDSLWVPQDRIVDTLDEECPHCFHEGLIVVTSPTTHVLRVDCAQCNWTVRFGRSPKDAGPE